MVIGLPHRRQLQCLQSLSDAIQQLPIGHHRILAHGQNIQQFGVELAGVQLTADILGGTSHCLIDLLQIKINFRLITFNKFSH